MALLTEGAGDMILLPSLMRLATGKSGLDFQVAPGIANYRGSGLEMEEVAARVVYLVDGDGGGDEHRKRLRGMGIPEARIKQFAPPKAVEDYVHPDVYISLVNRLIQAAGSVEQIVIADLDSSASIGKAVEIWCEARKIKPPGKTAVASLLVAEPSELKLADGAKAYLAELEAEVMAALSAKPGN